MTISRRAPAWPTAWTKKPSSALVSVPASLRSPDARTHITIRCVPTISTTTLATASPTLICPAAPRLPFRTAFRFRCRLRFLPMASSRPTRPICSRKALVAINTNFANPYVESWNFAIQRALPMGFTLDMAYVGSHGVDTVATYNLNTNLTTPGGGSAGQPLNQLFGKTAGVTLYFGGYSSSYNSLQAKLDRKLSSGLFMTTAFTWGKAMGYQSSDDGGLTFYINQARIYARADYFREYTYSQSFKYALPFGKTQRWVTSGPASYIIGGWQLSGIITLDSGIPMTFLANGTSLNTPGETQTADQVGAVQILHGINTGNPWFSTSSFAEPTGVRFGTSGRNILSGPALFYPEHVAPDFQSHGALQNGAARRETFNLTNTPQFSVHQTNP